MHLFLALALISFSAVADTIPGFEDSALLKEVMDGKIKVQEVSTSDTQGTFVIRAFIPKASPEMYAEVATNHKEYPAMFSEVKDAKTKSVNSDRTEWTYWMDIQIKVFLFSQHIFPEGKQVFERPADAVSEGVLTHTVANYADTLKDMVEKSRLIPYEGGILVHDYVHYELQKPSSFADTIRKKLKEQFVRFMTVYRKKLSDN